MKIVPKPSKIELYDGNFIYSSATKLEGATKLIEQELNFLDFSAAKANFIKFDICPSDYDYEIEIRESNIGVRAEKIEGLFHAAMTLKQLIFDGYENGISILCACKIQDKPRFAFRGFMLDVSRYFFTADVLKKVIDMLALAKVNVLHLHLSDNQGYRVESEIFPKLNEIGSKRAQTRGDGKPVEGYYTKAEIKDIVKYCANRYIEVIPEIDMPGHTIDMLASYPKLGCTSEQMKVSESWGVFEEILCAGKSEVYDFVFKLIDEVSALFPSKYFHIGGDEVPKTRWLNCPNCRKTMMDNGLKNGEELQAYFTNKVIAHLKSLGKVAIVWNEALKSGNLDPSAIVQYWNEIPRPKTVIAAANNGREVIVSKTFAYYLDYNYGMVSLKKAYNFEPLIKGLNEVGKSKIKGIEAPLWTEWVPTEQKLFTQAFPRMFAVAERGWSDDIKNYKDFENRLDSVLGIIQAYDYQFESAEKWNPNLFKSCALTIKFAHQWLEPKPKKK